MNRHFAVMICALALPASLIAQSARQVDTPRLRELTRKISTAPSDAWAWEERAHAYALLGEKALALEDLKQASARSPENEQLLRGIGWTLFNMQEYPRALQFWLRSGEISGYRESWHNYTVALGYWGVRDLATAAYYYDRAVAQEKGFGTWATLQKRVELLDESGTAGDLRNLRRLAPRLQKRGLIS